MSRRVTRWDLAVILVLLAAAGGWAEWLRRRPLVHCGCCAESCTLPCVDCCKGATPAGCPLPSALPEPLVPLGGAIPRRSE